VKLLLLGEQSPSKRRYVLVFYVLKIPLQQALQGTQYGQALGQQAGTAGLGE